MLPVRDAFTTESNPRLSANSAIISSAAFPKVAFSSPPTPGPSFLATCSVDSPSNPASGTIAAPAATNTHTASAPIIRITTAIGTKTSKSLSQRPLGSSQSSHTGQTPGKSPSPAGPLTRSVPTL